MLNKKPRISIIGLGKLGGPIAASIASRGFKVIGVDLSKSQIDHIKKCQVYLKEPGLAQILKLASNNFTATQKYSEAILNTDITYIIVPTPSKNNGSFSNKYIIQAIKKIGNILKIKSSYHIVTVMSTVSPQSIEKQLIPALEKTSKKICGKDFGLCYNPAFVSLGNVIKGFLYPDFILIGEFDQKSGNVLSLFYRHLIPNTPHIYRMNLINSEITKLALNTYVTTKISYANMLSQLCHHIPGADVDSITDALGADSRIGHKYLKGGTSFGGPCFPRDNKALISLGKKFKIDLSIAKTTDKINQQQIKLIKDIIINYIKPGQRISILGLSYRTDTDVIDESAGIKIAKELLEKGYKLTLYDPLSLLNAKKIFKSEVIYAKNLDYSLKNVSGIIITTPDKEFTKINVNMINKNNHFFIIDCWRLLKKMNFPKNIKYISIGHYI